MSNDINDGVAGEWTPEQMQAQADAAGVDLGAFDPTLGGDGSQALLDVEDWAPVDDRWSAGPGTTDLLADFKPEDLIASTDISAYVKDDVWYRGWLEFAVIKTQAMAVHKKSGLMAPIHCLFYEWVCVLDLDGIPDLPADMRDDGTGKPVVDPRVEGLIILPVRVAPGVQLATPKEHEEFQAALSRGQDNLAPFYAFAEMPLQPDPAAKNRLAPLGRYFTRKDERNGKGQLLKPGMHPNWQGIFDYSLGSHAPMGFPVRVKRSAPYWNAQVLDKAQVGAELSAKAERARQQRIVAEGIAAGGQGQAAPALGYTETSLGTIGG